MFVSNPSSSSVTLPFVEAISGAIAQQIHGSSGVSLSILSATGMAMMQAVMTLSGSTVVDGLLTATTNGPATRLIVDTYNSANVFGSSIRGRRARGTSAAPSGVLSGDVFLQLVGDGYDGTGFINAKASVVLFAAEDWGPGRNGTYAIIRTTPTGSSVVQERVRIAPDGSVGIGVIAPAYRLDVAGGANFTEPVRVNGVPIGGGGAVTWTVPVPTGVSSLTVALPTPFASPPQLTWGVGATGPVTYLATPQAITVSGFVAQFSDTVLEPGVTLTATASPAV